MDWARKLASCELITNDRILEVYVRAKYRVIGSMAMVGSLSEGDRVRFSETIYKCQPGKVNARLCSQKVLLSSYSFIRF